MPNELLPQRAARHGGDRNIADKDRALVAADIGILGVLERHLLLGFGRSVAVDERLHLVFVPVLGAGQFLELGVGRHRAGVGRLGRLEVGFVDLVDLFDLVLFVVVLFLFVVVLYLFIIVLFLFVVVVVFVDVLLHLLVLLLVLLLGLHRPALHDRRCSGKHRIELCIKARCTRKKAALGAFRSLHAELLPHRGEQQPKF